MFRGSIDVAHGLAVWLFTPGPNTDDDWRAYCDALREVTTALSHHPSPFAVQVIDPKSEDPNAHWRREIAEIGAAAPPRSTIAIVSQSTMVRAAVKAITWLRPPTYTLKIVATEDEAFELARAEAPGRGAIGRTMLADLRRRG
ncbi:MAG TPA: hypothetical protein VF407_12630 [Polyangiaceae bacterium]